MDIEIKQVDDGKFNKNGLSFASMIPALHIYNKHYDIYLADSQFLRINEMYIDLDDEENWQRSFAFLNNDNETYTTLSSTFFLNLRTILAKRLSYLNGAWDIEDLKDLQIEFIKPHEEKEK